MDYTHGNSLEGTLKINYGWPSWLRTRLLLALLAPTAIFSTAIAAEREEVCVKYEREHGWSKGYAVLGTVISGSDMNSKVGSLSRFKSFSTYVVVFWDDDQATILELPALSMGSLPIFESQVRDQQGRLWKLKQGHSFCS